VEKLICPAMSVDDKYRTLYAALMGVFKEIADFGRENLPSENLQGLVNAAMRGAGLSVGIRLKRVYGLKDTVEDALKMLVLFHNEALAYLPKLKQVYGELAGKREGFLTVKRDPWYDWYFKDLPIDCEESCICHEFPALLSVLGPDFKIECTRALPRGDDLCSFRITKK
jgi:hypothetical protein